MRLLTRLGYYASSIATLLTGFRHPLKIVAIFLHWPMALPTEVQLRRSGFRFKVREAIDVWVIKETCIDRDYLQHTELEPDWTIVDVGAGLGDFTVLAAKSCPLGKVHAYEPLAESFQLLQANLSLNDLSNVEAFPLAAAGHAYSLTVDSAETRAVSKRFVAADDQAGVATVELAEILNRLPGRICDFLKIDCEGCEFDVILRSSSETLSRILRLSMETHDGYARQTSQDLVAYLEQQGFSVWQRKNPVHANLGFLYAERSQELELDSYAGNV